VYTFSATAGTTYNAAISVISGFAPALVRITVFAPDGTLVGSTATTSTQQVVSFPAAVTGDYVFVVNTDDLVSTGTYEVTVF